VLEFKGLNYLVKFIWTISYRSNEYGSISKMSIFCRKKPNLNSTKKNIGTGEYRIPHKEKFNLNTFLSMWDNMCIIPMQIISNGTLKKLLN
jgi:hypothetical protein